LKPSKVLTLGSGPIIIGQAAELAKLLRAPVLLVMDKLELESMPLGENSTLDTESL